MRNSPRSNLQEALSTIIYFYLINFGSASKLGKCHVCATVDESYTVAQWLAHLPGKQNVPGSNSGGAA